MYALLQTPSVRTAITVGLRHDDGLCVTCGSDKHQAAKCKAPPTLPVAEAVEKERQNAAARVTKAEQAAAESQQDAQAARQSEQSAVTALQGAPAVAHLAKAAPTPATNCDRARHWRKNASDTGQTLKQESAEVSLCAVPCRSKRSALVLESSSKSVLFRHA